MHETPRIEPLPRLIGQSFGIEVSSSVIEDASMRAADHYEMTHPGVIDTSAIRTTFVIEPVGTTARCWSIR